MVTRGIGGADFKLGHYQTLKLDEIFGSNRASSSNRIVSDRCLADVDPELEQLPVNARRAPQRVVDTDLADQPSNLYRYTRTPGFASRSVLPEQATPMPSHQRFGTNDRDRWKHAGLQVIEDRKKQTVRSREFRPLSELRCSTVT